MGGGGGVLKRAPPLQLSATTERLPKTLSNEFETCIKMPSVILSSADGEKSSGAKIK